MQTQEEIIQRYLNRVKTWAIAAYQEIMEFRSLLTGQTFYYDIEYGSTKSYRLTEKEYIKLLFKNNLTTKTENWENIRPEDLASVLSLSVNYNKDMMQDMSYHFIGRSKDPLQKFLYENYSSKQNEKEALYESRLYEIYDQVRISIFNGEYYLSKENFEKNKRKVENFVDRYIESNLHKDTVAFYKQGDSVESAIMLIENKRTGGAVSIKTVKNAIINLSKIFNESTSKKELQNKLKDFFIEKSKNTSIEKEIYKAAETYAERQINKFFKENLTGVKLEQLLTK